MLERGKFGIEYTPRPPDEGSGVLGWTVVAVIVVAAVSLTWTLYTRFRDSPPPEDEPPNPPPALPSTATNHPPARPAVAAGSPAASTSPSLPASGVSSLAKRPVKVRNLLMRLEKAKAAHDVEMAVTTIEEIRSLPGSPAADIDDELARLLGTLNVRRLFDRERNKLWVAEVVVKRGDSASRIASEHASTLASLRRLNPGIDLDRVRIGQKIYVMRFPRFNLVVHRRARTADLQLNGKFFKRYDLTGETKMEAGAYEWRGASLGLKPVDRAELECLLPRSAPVVVSEM